MKNLAKISSGQATVEWVFVCSIFTLLLIGSYILGKVILHRQSSAILSRNIAFKNTYDGATQTLKEIESYGEKDTDSTYDLSEARACSNNGNELISILGKIADLISSRKESVVTSSLKIEDNYRKLINEIEKEHHFKESLLMSENTWAGSNKVRFALYGIALAKAALSTDSDLASLGNQFFEASGHVQEEQNFEMEVKP